MADKFAALNHLELALGRINGIESTLRMLAVSDYLDETGSNAIDCMAQSMEPAIESVSRAIDIVMGRETYGRNDRAEEDGRQQ